ncbi:MAG: carboxylesterase/lipase family protein [Dehalococcoidales bacterium]|nr:carboxylesterase/lipase family protein [Dehalococcoidales bacterium]
MSTDKQAVVTTKSGKLEGIYQDGLCVFKGIPYAEPPVGTLRWMPPQPVKKWDGVRPAKEYGAMAPQLAMAGPSDSPGAPNFGNVPQSEDCLFLNIWTPGLDDKKRPVMFWIHGGAFIIGAGSETFLDSGVLPKRGDIVLVSINYRLGVPGFLNLNEITGGKIPSTGNEGILDQVAALEWVQENIADFGGNPDNITIFGFSAGGMSIGTLLALPAAKGLFHKAMNRSGAANVVSTLDSAVDIAEQYLSIYGLSDNDTDGIRNLSTQQLLDGQQKLGERLREQENRATPFQPVVDGKVLPELPLIAIRNGSARNITLMAGNSRDELKSTYGMNPAMKDLDESGIIERLNANLPPEIVPRLVQAYRESMKRENPTVTPLDIFGSINTDLMFRIPTLRLVEAQRENGVKSYNYLCAYKSPAMGGVLGAMHGLDNPFLFGTLDSQFTGNGIEQQSMAIKMQDSSVAFARTGNPSCESIGTWLEYGTERNTMVFDINTRVEKAPYEEERHAWDSYDYTITKPM